MYRAVIVEDEAIAAMLARKYLEQDGRFRVEREFRTGRAALDHLLVHPADLMILDIYLPQFSGVELLRELRAADTPTSAIVVTGASDRQTITDCLRLGVVDYLVKPAPAERFARALDAFCRCRAMLTGDHPRTQLEIDLLLSHTVPSDAPKGLQPATQERILACLRQTPGGCTSETLAARVGLSAVTVRRYMRYLIDQGRATGRVNYQTGGRPSILYYDHAS